jgi:hypothetical protein
MQDHSTSVVQTVACDLGNCGSCRGQVLTLTTAGINPCTHICHLPDAWAEQVAAYPPCDEDVVIDHDELEAIAEAEADRRLDDERAWS